MLNNPKQNKNEPIIKSVCKKVKVAIDKNIPPKIDDSKSLFMLNSIPYFCLFS